MTEEEIAKIEKYNKEYNKYLGQYVYGTEVITVINRALNEKETNNNDIKIDLKFEKEQYNYEIQYYKNGKKNGAPKRITIKKGEELSIYTKNEEGMQTGYSFIYPEDGSGNPNENIEQLKSKAFRCDKIDYDNKTGKVSYMHFTEMDYEIKNKEIWQ